MVSMRMGLEMRMSQQLIMTPQLQQAIKLLQLSRIELEELIDQNLIENPTLEMTPVEDEDEKTDDSKKDKDEAENLMDEQVQLSYDDEWQNYIESGAGVMQDVRNRSSDSDDTSNPLEATISRATTLMDHLFWQLDMSNFNDINRDIAEFLIGNIDDEGYLSISLRDLLATTPELHQLVKESLLKDEVESLTDEASVAMFDLFHENREKVEKQKKGRKKKAPIMEDEEENGSETIDFLKVSNKHCGVLELVLKKIQLFDPPGVATRTLQECLQNQLKTLNMSDSLAMRIINENMQFLEQKDLKKIARLQKADIQEVVKAYQIITELEPKPGRPFGREVTQYVVPDVFIYKRGNEYVVSMNQDSIPRLRINPYYQSLIKLNKEDKEQAQAAKKPESDDQDMTYQYILEKIKAGDWLMKSIEQRQKTIYRVTKSILKFQNEFFEKGIDYLKPLVLKDVAEDIDVHESTVSRITTNKYVYTPQGIFELKYFFTSGIDQGDGDIISSKKIKDYIQKLIETEDKKRPYTDLQIKNELLENASIKVARRTVAKYREAMNILPSNKRKKLF